MLATFEEAVQAARKLIAKGIMKAPAAIMQHVGDSGRPGGDIKGTLQYTVWDEERATKPGRRDDDHPDRAFVGVAWVEM